MKPSEITEELVRRRVDRRVFERGKAYFDDDAVDRLTRRGDTLTAQVYGSDEAPYEVTIRLGTVDIADADCTCPYGHEFGGWCKHIVAALLACARSADRIAEVPPVAQWLDGLSREDLVRLVLALAERHPDLADDIALWKAAPPIAAGTSAPPVNVAALAQRIGDEFRTARRRYDYHDRTLPHLLDQLTQQANERARTGDAAGALAILETAIDRFLAHGWAELDHDGDFDFNQVGQAFAEALLDPDLPAMTRRALLPRLRTWQSALDNYGGGELETALHAAESGWEDPNLRAALRGELASPPSPMERYLARFRVEILQRRQRNDEALNVALWARQDRDACLLLIAQGRAAEAETYGLRRLESAQDRLVVAHALHAAGERAAALRLAEAGLDTPDPDEDEWVQDDEEDPAIPFEENLYDRLYRAGSYFRYPLAVWLRDAAAAEGAHALAVRAGTVAVTAQPRREDWSRLADLTGAGWPALRDELLATLAADSRSIAADGIVDILLAEARVVEAWNLVRDSHDPQRIARVADAAATQVPDQVIDRAQRFADEIMEGGASGRYEEAQAWLRRMKSALIHQGKEEIWKARIAERMTQHARKYKLMPLLRALQ